MTRAVYQPMTSASTWRSRISVELNADPHARLYYAFNSCAMMGPGSRAIRPDADGKS
jgi:hypothetical protein